MKKNLFAIIVIIVICGCSHKVYNGAASATDAAMADPADLMSDTWVATDALGRTMPSAQDVGKRKTDKQRTVGIFYITWHTPGNHSLTGPYTNVTEILNTDPEARHQADNPLWRYGTYHWGEPEMGYFLSQDEWVIRKDISMLQDAGVDVLVMDVTNGVCYWDEWEVLFSTMMKMRSEGNQTPQFVFWSYNGNPVNIVKQLYERYYKVEKYKDLWFYWDGKPLLLYNADPSNDANGTYDITADAYPDVIRSFFTLRNMWWGFYEWFGSRYIGTEDNWSFGYSMGNPNVKKMTPEELVSRHNGEPEEAAVTPAQHPLGLDGETIGIGKSWSKEFGEPELDSRDMPRQAYVPWLGKTVDNPTAYGIYFQERWDDALAVDPPFIYLNDWNEWTAGKYNWGDRWFLGRENNPFCFVDQYNAEFNRTIQPMKGGYTDNYYMQMAQNIRRYKGARDIPVNYGRHSIKIDGRFDDWGDNGIVTYRDTRGDITHRDADGYAGLHYTDATGRNDIVEARAAITRKGIAFYVKTTDAITPPDGNDWMLLLIDADQDNATGWHGYDYVVNRKVVDSSTTALMKYDNGMWKEMVEVKYAINGNEMELLLPKGLLSESFDFKWADNPGELDDIISLCTHGDTAPNRRFNYRFIKEGQKAK